MPTSKSSGIRSGLRNASVPRPANNLGSNSRQPVRFFLVILIGGGSGFVRRSRRASPERSRRDPLSGQSASSSVESHWAGTCGICDAPRPPRTTKKKGPHCGPSSCKRVSLSTAHLRLHVAPRVHAASLRVLGKVRAHLLQRRENLHAFVQIIGSVLPNPFKLLGILARQNC